MADSYENVQRGKLKLKKSPLEVKRVDTKKKRKRKVSSNSAASEASTSEEMHTHFSSQSKGEQEVQLTPAERKFREVQKKREHERIAKMAEKSHKEKTKEFNEYLDRAPKHFDIPKVGPG
mmetsp:Transcript_1553/g.4221  ORF Transcript_1553/g.4221 Transcript_1553/m.4221 type:complete len:120 (-) Transcript_1553:382-741(-)|eukprot:CAMPEP_0119135534 /NCGR_PEP_ID=MMETSP1310-20130426/19475_1 /TAXON_ID=464262 /ORGANISM="Genus nov. species nov., Strain RCC2339" /LENGTH=119 /DNA_ID=CAMNT_0007126427 /DNA_START=43 /DNA_END=402 /DNA_ORIENTATION=-